MDKSTALKTETAITSDVVIIGAGPTGLTAAYQLAKLGQKTIVFEKERLVGGIARTENYKGYGIDIGGHRFYTKVAEVEAMWHEVLGDDFLPRRRLSRIYYKNKFFYYPIRFFDALFKLGLVESVRVGASYGWAKIHPYPQEENFEEWVSNRFGRRLYQIFFKTYTEKVWGMPCTEIKAEWAAQRIKGLSLSRAVKDALFKPKNQQVKTLIDTFHYPRRGPGMLWRRVQELIEAQGHRVMPESDVVEVYVAGGRVKHIVANSPNGPIMALGRHFISSMPLSELILKIKPTPPSDVVTAARQLAYRDFLTVALIVRRDDLFPDNWIYIHSPEVKVGRIQNFKNWSPEMIPPAQPETTCIGLEYFCAEGDELWQMADADLVALGRQEMARMGLVAEKDVVEGVVLRQPKAYPVYMGAYQKHLDIIRTYLDTIENLQSAGRNGLHMYNNQDHSMLTAMLAVKNITGEKHNLWSVNTERSYHEEVYINQK
ncbi:MAG: NAD(P)/FAD-dependent oxidoreductase [Anaerolineae bacterium]|nr:NAD(P)/FAD-dependent oxidoreductase [Anaerolineae bacterium]